MSWIDALSGTGSDESQLDTPDYSGSDYSAAALGIPQPTDYSLAGDQSDAQQMAPWNPAPAAAAGQPWFQGIMQYGITKAIDNAFPNSPTGVMGNVYPGSTAGANGRTYGQVATNAGGGVIAARASMGGSIGGVPLILILAAVGIYLVVR